MKKAVAIYCRVSTQQQKKEQTIRTQISKLREAYKNENIVKEYTDVCSGAYLSRTGLNQLRKDAQQGLFDVIAIYALDRLSRKLSDQLGLSEEFEGLEIKVESLTEKFEDSDAGKLSRNVMGAVAEWERKKIAQRMNDGKWRRAGEGELIGCYPPYGYRLIKKTENKKAHFVINSKEARVVRLMFKTYLEEESIRQTTKRLYEMGIKGRGRGKKKPIAFVKGTVARMLKNEAYIGNFHFGKTYHCEAEYHIKEDRETKLSGRKYRPKTEWQLIRIPAIIDKETFERVQAMREKRESKKSRLMPSTHFYLCQGLIKCIHCGRTYGGHPNGRIYKGKTYLTYRCPQRNRGQINEARCQARQMSVQKLDGIVWEYISALIQDKKKVKRSVKLWNERRNKEKSFHQKVYNSLLTEKGKVQTEKQRMLGLYGSKSILKKDLEKAISKLNAQELELDKQTKEVRKELAEIKNFERVDKEIERLCNQYSKGISNPTLEQKKYIVRKWIKEINVLGSGNLKITVKLPEADIRKFDFKKSRAELCSVSSSSLQNIQSPLKVLEHPIEFEEVLAVK